MGLLRQPKLIFRQISIQFGRTNTVCLKKGYPLKSSACAVCSSLNVAKLARHLAMQMQFFCVFRPYKESIKEMNNDHDLNLHSMIKLSGWLRYWL